MDSKQSPAEDTVRDQAALIAWEQCLKENGLSGAIGCAHLAIEAADAFMAERNKRVTNGEQL
jgi:hypothetical protein